jgi:hypothetical protein
MAQHVCGTDKLRQLVSDESPHSRVRGGRLAGRLLQPRLS